MDSVVYNKYQSERENAFEAICYRCGECCGSLDDPCRNLEKKSDGTYFCKGYSDRLGPQQTKGGRFFNCVSIREHIREDTLRPDCAYRKVSHI